MFWERFYSLCESVKSKPNPVGQKLGFSSGLISKWKRKSEAGEDLLLRDKELTAIADFFDCSVDYLLCRTDVKEIARSGFDLSEDEKELLRYFRGLGRTEQRHVLNYAEAESEKGSASTPA